MGEKNQALTTVVLMMIANFLVKFFGLLREILIAKYYGTTLYTDAYIIANNIPTVLFAALGSAIATSFIPMYSQICYKKNEARANSFTLHLIQVIMLICVALTILGEVFIRQIVHIFALGFTGEVLNVTSTFARILFPSIFGMALFNLFGSYLQQHSKFKVIALVPIAGNLTIILSLVISNIERNVYIFVWGTLFGLLAQILFYLPWVIKTGLFAASWKGFPHDSYLKQLLPLVIPVFIGEAANEINSIVDRTLVSGLETGSVSSLNYAYKVINLIIGIVVASMVTILYPQISKLAASKKKKEFAAKSENAIMAIFAMVLPISLAVIIFKGDIVRILFQRGSFDEVSALRTAQPLAYYAVGLSAMGIRDILARVFYSLHDTKSPMLNGILCAMLNVFLDIILVPVLGHNGAAFATAISAIISVLVLLKLCKKRAIINIRRILPSFSKTLFSSAVFGILLQASVMWLQAKHNFSFGYLLLCVILFVLALVIYLFLQLIIKNKIILDLIKALRKKHK